MSKEERKGILDFPSYSEENHIPQNLESFNEFGKAKIFSEVTETNNLQIISKIDLEYYLDYDKICGRVVLRSREDGDRITLASRKCTKSLKKLFNELAIPPELRNEVVVLGDDNGVLLVEGAGVDQRVSVTKNTCRILKIRIER